MTLQATHPYDTTQERLIAPLRACRIAAIAIAFLAAVGVMAGESWVLKNTPGTAVACEIGQASDLTRALDSGIAAISAAAE
jgi:hypothetical protein